MDLGYLKIKIDIRAEHNSLKKKYDYKRKELKKEEIKKIFDGFKEFFKSDGHFKFKENEHSIAAEYRDHAIKLDMDVYKNIDSPDFKIVGIIKTYEKDTFEFVAEGLCNKEMTLQPVEPDENEKLVMESKLYQDFLDGEIKYDFVYSITGREGEYDSIQALLIAL
ncbi:hypothetical protein [Flavobacterium sp.]|uniref:hypothetical protein n=1 Tax=Flavobacterium sp. TaxID=239 RepID=UPI0040332E4A